MKITSVCPYYYGGGAEVMWSNMIRLLGHEIEFDHVIPVSGRVLGEFNMPIKPRLIFSDEELPEIKSDLVVSWGPVVLNKKPKSKWVFFAHHENSKGSFDMIKEHCVCSFAISNYIKKKVCGGKNSIVIPCGTEENKVCNGKSLRKELGFSDHDFVVGFVGTLSKNKNYDKVVVAVEQMPDQFKCLLVGKSDGTPLISGRKTKFISVKNKDISSVYSTVDCVVLPSLQEGMPLVMWETMANRVPFLTTACSSQSDFVVHNMNSIVVSPDPDCIAKECIRLSSDSSLAEFITENAYDLFLKNGTMEDTLNAFKRAISICDEMKVF